MEEYLDEIRLAVLASLGMALDADPLADVVVLATRDGDVSKVVTVARPLAVEHLRESASERLVEIAERIASPPASHDARWLVMVTADFSASTSVALVDVRTGARA